MTEQREPTLAEYLDAETTQARIRTSVLAAMEAIRAEKFKGRSVSKSIQATIITACVLEALRPIAPESPPADEVVEEDERAAA